MVKLTELLRKHWYHLLLFCVTLGTTELIYNKMISAGHSPNYFLYLPILCAELIIATAAIHGIIGILAALGAFLLLVGAIYLSPDFIHAYFPAMVLLGSIRYWVSQRYQKDSKPREVKSSVVIPKSKNQSVGTISEIARKYNKSIYIARKIKAKLEAGEPIPIKWQ